MNWPLERRNPAGGPGSEGASLGGGMHAHDTGDVDLLQSASLAVDHARALLARYGESTDTPTWDAVQAADLLDAARAALDGVP